MRDAVLVDAPECGRICHDAFAALATRHGFLPDFPSVEVAVGAVAGLIEHSVLLGGRRARWQDCGQQLP
ncbi:MAG: hypothetical protein WCD11_26455 [Solirubrobacteraceae bacterium]